jgi:hypothetical protein
MKILNKNEQKNIRGGNKPSPRDCAKCLAICASLPSSQQGGCAEGGCFGCEDY